MLQSLAIPIARSVINFTTRADVEQNDDHLLEKEILQCVGQRVMLSCNLWVKAGLVNGALGVIIQIVYTLGFTPHKLPTYVVVEFDNYIGPPWGQSQPKHINPPQDGLGIDYP